MQKIEIQGGIVRLVNTVVEREMLLEDFKSNLFETRAFSTPRLPVKCCFVLGATNGVERVAYVVERPPQLAHMTLVAKDDHNDWDPDAPDDEPFPIEEYDVHVPWQYWIVITDHNQVGANRPGRIPTWPVRGILYVWSETQVESIEEAVLYRASVPNTNGATHFCMGRTDYDTETLDGMIDSIVDTWWAVPFNTDLGRNIPMEYSSLQEWDDRGTTPKRYDGDYLYSLRNLVESSLGYPMLAEPPGLSRNSNGAMSLVNETQFREWLEHIDPVWAPYLKVYVDRAYNENLNNIRDEAERQAVIDRERNERLAAERVEMRRRWRIQREQEAAAARPPTEDPGLADLMR